LCNSLKIFSLFCTNSGKKFFRSLCKLPIDKICNLWYNGNFGAQRRKAPRQIAQKFSTLLIKIVQLAHSSNCTIKKLLKTVVQNTQMAFCTTIFIFNHFHLQIQYNLQQDQIAYQYSPQLSQLN
jgi:hypothetical protein